MEPIDRDTQIAKFFSSMRSQDLKRKAPEFPRKKKIKIKKFWMASLGVAASLLLGVLLLIEKDPTEILLKDQIIFTLHEDTLNGTTYFEVTEASSMDTWEPATQSLLDEL